MFRGLRDRHDSVGGTAISDPTGIVPCLSEMGSGSGSTNIDMILASPDPVAGPAAAVLRRCTGGGKSAGFLPSKDKLNEMYRQRVNVGGLGTPAYFCSSSRDIRDVVWGQELASGHQSFHFMYCTVSVPRFGSVIVRLWPRLSMCPCLFLRFTSSPN